MIEDETIDIDLVIKIYGIRRNINQSSPAWERIEDNVEKQANAVHGEQTINTTINDFDNIRPWSNIRTCALDKNGNVLKYITDADWNWNYDYIMTEIPEFWWNREQKTENGIINEYIYISEKQTEKTPYKSNKFFINRFHVTGSSSNITCKSGIAPLANISMDNFRTSIRNIGENWYQLDLWRWSIIQMLYLVEYATYDSKSKLGYGASDTSKPINNGELNSLEMKSGYLINDKAHAVIYRGIENIFGNVWSCCDGINFASNQAYVSKDILNYKSNSIVSPYTKLSYICPTSTGFIKVIGYDANFPSVQLPKETGGASSTYITDNVTVYSNNGIFFVGGSYSQGLKNGLFNYNIGYSNTYAGATVGCRSIYIPESEAI